MGKSQPGLSGYRKKKEQGTKIQQSGLSDSQNYEQGSKTIKSGLSDSKKEQHKSTRSGSDGSVEILDFFTRLEKKQQRFLDGRSLSKGFRNFVICIEQDLSLAKDLLREIDIPGVSKVGVVAAPQTHQEKTLLPSSEEPDGRVQPDREGSIQTVGTNPTHPTRPDPTRPDPT